MKISRYFEKIVLPKDIEQNDFRNIIYYKSLIICLILFFSDSSIDEKIYGIASGTDKEENNKGNKVDKSKLTFRHHSIMDVEKCKQIV